MSEKEFTLVYTKNVRNDEQITLLIDENKKIAYHFYTDGYDGINADKLKSILNFLGIECFECVYSKIPEKYYKEYKEYDWRNPIHNITN